MAYRIIIMLFVCFFSIAASACEQSDLPVDLLGRNIYKILPTFIESMYDGDFEDHDYNDKHDERWLVIDENRHYARLQAADGIVWIIDIFDDHYSTQEGIRVGDSFAKVHSTYSDANFVTIDGVTPDWLYDLVMEYKEFRVIFLFDDSEITDMGLKGKDIGLKDEIVQQMKLRTIVIEQV